MDRKTWIIVCAGLIVMAFLFLVGGFWAIQRAEGAPTPVKLAGHRGATVGVDENTISAFKYALPYADILETDVRITSDRKMVIMHDATLDRTTNCTGKVSERTLAFIKLCKTPRGQHPPSLRQFLQWAGGQDKRIGLYLELKGSWSQYRVDRFVNEATNYDALTDITVQSFSEATLDKVITANDSLPDEKSGLRVKTAFVEGGDPTYGEPFRVCDSYDVYINDYRNLKKTYVEALQVSCNPPTIVAVYGRIDTTAEYEAALATGAKVLIVEDPKAARGWLNSR